MKFSPLERVAPYHSLQRAGGCLWLAPSDFLSLTRFLPHWVFALIQSALRSITAWVPRVRVWCWICRPAPTPYPSWVTCRFQPPIPTLDMGGVSALCRLSYSSTYPLPCPSHHLEMALSSRL